MSSCSRWNGSIVTLSFWPGHRSTLRSLPPKMRVKGDSLVSVCATRAWTSRQSCAMVARETATGGRRKTHRPRRRDPTLAPDLVPPLVPTAGARALLLLGLALLLLALLLLEDAEHLLVQRLEEEAEELLGVLLRAAAHGVEPRVVPQRVVDRRRRERRGRRARARRVDAGRGRDGRRERVHVVVVGRLGRRRARGRSRRRRRRRRRGRRRRVLRRVEGGCGRGRGVAELGEEGDPVIGSDRTSQSLPRRREREESERGKTHMASTTLFSPLPSLAPVTLAPMASLKSFLLPRSTMPMRFHRSPQ